MLVKSAGGTLVDNVWSQDQSIGILGDVTLIRRGTLGAKMFQAFSGFIPFSRELKMLGFVNWLLCKMTLLLHDFMTV